MSSEKNPLQSRNFIIGIVIAFFILNAVGIIAIYKKTADKQPSDERLLVINSPADKVLDAGEPLVFEFNQSINPKSFTQEAIKIDPPVDGEVTMPSDNTILFTPRKHFDYGRNYKVTLSPAIRTAKGVALSAPYEFMFQTNPLTIKKVSQVAYGIGNDLSATLEFELNGEVNPYEFAEQISITDWNNDGVSMTIEGQHPSKIIQIRTGDIRTDMIAITNRKQDADKKSVMNIAPFFYKLKISRQVKLISTKAEWDNNRTIVILSFNAPVLHASAKNYISISPEMEFGVTSYYRGIALEGNFEPGKRYTIQIKKGLPSGNGSAIEKDIERTVWFGDAPGYLRFKFPGHYLSSEGEGLIPVVSTNIEKFSVKAYRVYPNNLIQYINHVGSYIDPYLVKPLNEEAVEYKIEGEKNKEAETIIDIREFLAGFKTGLILLDVTYQMPRQAGDDYYRYWTPRTNTLVVFTDIGISCRQGGDSVTVWINSLKTSEPVKEAVVELYSIKNQLIGTGETDAEGIATVEIGETDEQDYLSAIIVRKDEDVSYLHLASGGVARDTNHNLREYLSEGYEAFVTTERGIYRPGEDVHIEAILRDSGKKAPGEFPVDLVIYKPGNRELSRSRHTLDKQGGFSADVRIPRYEMTGEYSAVVVLPGEKNALGSTRFSVHDFMPRRIEAGIEIEDKRFKSKEEIPFTVTAKHLFGEPAKGLEVQSRYLWDSTPFAPPDPELAKYTYGDGRISAHHSSGNLPDSKTDDKGTAKFTIKPESFQTPSPLTLQIHPVILEEGNRPTPLFKSVIVDVYDFYLGVKGNFEGTAAPGKDIAFDVIALNPDGNLLSNPTKCEVQLVRSVYSNVLKRVEGYYRYEWVKEEIKEDAGIITLENGKGTVILKTTASGSHRIVVSSTGGCAATFDFYAYAEGEDSFAIEGPEKLNIELDKKEYKAGETATAKINSTIKGRMLVTVESDRILFRKTILMTSRSETVEIPVLDSYIPNVYLTATVVRPTSEAGKWTAHRTSGVALIRVDASSNKLNLMTEIPESVKPGEAISVIVNALSGETPIADSRIFLAAIDEGVLQIDNFKTPDPFGFFYGVRRLGVSESDIYNDLLPEIIKVLKESEPGGDGAIREAEFARRMSPIDVQRVKVVSLFSDAKFTGESGSISFDLTIPKYHGKLRIMAFGAHDSLFGSIEKTLIVKSPLMMDCSFPRFLAPKDRCLVACTIRNKTGMAGTAKLEFDVDGPVICEEKSPVEIEVKKDEDVTRLVAFKALEDCGKAVVNYKVTLGDESYDGSIELPVRPAKPVAHEYLTGEVSAPITTTIKIPGNWYKGTESSLLVIGGFPWLSLSGCVANLLDYPYGCLEQTVSRGVPLLYLPDLAKMVRPGSVGEDEVNELVEMKILRLRSMQTYNGGLAYWPGYSNAYEFGSAYAADFLIEAKKAGYSVQEDMLEALLDYLQKSLSLSSSNQPAHLGIKAYHAYVLTKAGMAPREWLVRLEEKYEELGPTARCHLASAIYLSGYKKDAEKLIRFGLGTPREERDIDGYLHSLLREKAIILMTLLDILPEDPSITPMALALAKSLSSRDIHFTTQENAWALMALAKYARQSGDVADWICTITMPDGTKKEFKNDESITLSDVAGSEIGIEIKGTGKLYYSIMSSGVPVEGEVEAVSRGIKVGRSYYSVRNGEKVNGNELKAGEVYYAVLTISTDMPYENLIISDLLPAGLEVESMEQSFLTENKMARINVIHSEKRDDRVIIFTGTEAANAPASYCYAVRAVTPGSYILPALEAECMYNNDIFFVGDESRLEIRK